MENSMNPGQLASQYPAELDLQGFQNGVGYSYMYYIDESPILN